MLSNPYINTYHYRSKIQKGMHEITSNSENVSNRIKLNGLLKGM